MFENIEYNKRILIGAYRKLKGYYFYNKSLLYIRKIIADFEYDPNSFDRTFTRLAKLLKNPRRKNNIEFINKLINHIDIVILPKSFEEDESDNDININGKNKNLKEVNFFIKAPIELLILDTLWLLFLGKIAYDNNTMPKYSYGNVLHYRKLFAKDIDFDTNALFKLYSYQYSNWRDKAFNQIEKNYHENKNSLLVSLDLKSYFYLVKFRFSDLHVQFGEHSLFAKIQMITSIIEQAYCAYTTIIKKYRKDVFAQNKENIFPIGFLSSLILSDYYLKPLDDIINKKMKCLYYGRYVDDVLLVINKDLKRKINKEKLLDELFIQTDLFINNKDLKITVLPNLHIQRKKIIMLYFNCRRSKNLINIYNSLIKITPSETNIIPDYELNDLSFDENAYFLSKISNNNTLGDLNFIKTNSYKAIKYISSITKCARNTMLINRQRIIDKQCKEIFDHYSGLNAFEFMNAWLWIFDFAVIIEREKELGNSFYSNIANQINSLVIKKLDYIDNRRLNTISKNIKLSLNEELLIAVSSAAALNVKKYPKAKIHSLSLKLKNANMFNDKLCAIPLLNYSCYSDGDNSLLEIDINKIKKTEALKLKGRKIRYAPRFIHLNEIFHFYFLRDYNKGGNIFKDNIERLITN